MVEHGLLLHSGNPDVFAVAENPEDGQKPQDAKIKKILNIVVVIVVVLWLLSVFGVLGHGEAIRVPRVQ